MDGLSVASSIISLIDLGKLLYTYVRDVIKAGEERKQLLEVLDNLNLVLELLEEREAKARRDPKIPWYQGLIALDKSATIANGQSISDGTGKGTGALRRLKEAMEKMTSELDISTGKERSVQRIMWPHKKVKFQAMLAEIERWQIQINTILDQDQFRLSEDNNARVQNIQDSISTFRNDTQIISINTDIIRNESKVIQNDTRTIRDDTKILQLDARDTNNRLRALEERGQRKDRAKERQAIISWLSPLEFRRRQTEILNAKCIWTAKRLLDSLEFNLWVSGRHWELSCQGQPGAGKVQKP